MSSSQLLSELAAFLNAITEESRDALLTELIHTCVQMGDHKTLINLLMEFKETASCIQESYPRSNHLTVYLSLCYAALHGDVAFIQALLSRSPVEDKSITHHQCIPLWREILHAPLMQFKLPLITPIKIAYQAGQNVAVIALLQAASKFVKNSTQALNISRLSLKGEYLGALADMSKEQFQTLQTLNLLDNPLGTLDPLPFSSLTNLTHINASMCGLKNVPPELFLLPSVFEIKLTENHLVELPDLPPETHTSAVFLYLSYNSINHIPSTFRAPKLQHLELQCNCLTDVPKAVLAMLELNYLKLSNNPFLHRIPFELGQMPKLQHLILEKLKIQNLPSIITPKMSLDYLKPSKMALVESRHFEVVFIGTAHSREAHSDLVDTVSKLSLAFSVISCPTPSMFLASMEAILNPPQLFVFVITTETASSCSLSSFQPIVRCLSLVYEKSAVVVACCRNNPESLEPDCPLNPDLLSDISKLAMEFPTCSIVPKRVEITIKSTLESDIKHFITLLEGYGAEMSQPILVPHFNSVFSQYFKVDDEVIRSKRSGRNRGDTKPPICYGRDLTTAIEGIENDVCLPEASWLVDTLEKSGRFFTICNKKGIVFNRQWLCDFVSCAINVVHSNAFVSQGFLPHPSLATIFSNLGFQHSIPDVLLMYLVNTGIAFPIRQETFFVPHTLGSDPETIPVERTCSRVIAAPILTPGFWNRLLAHVASHKSSLLECSTLDGRTVASGGLENIKSEYWDRGVVVNRGFDKFCFAIRGYQSNNMDCCEIIVPLTPLGTSLMTKLFNLCTSLLRNWFPFLWSKVQVYIPCSKCRIKKVSNVFHHSFIDCTRRLLLNKPLSCPVHQEADVYPLSLLPDLLGEGLLHNCAVKCTGLGSRVEKHLLSGSQEDMILYRDEAEFIRLIHLLLEIKSLGNPHLANVQSIDVGIPFSYSYSLQDYVSLRSLLENTRESVTPHIALQILIQTTEALQNLHSKGIAHRNVSVDSVMVKIEDSELEVDVKLASFENASNAIFNDFFRGKCGTFPAPEMLLDNEKHEYDSRVDVYALAFLAYHLFTGIEFHPKLSLHQKPHLDPLAAVSPLLVTTFGRCWQSDPGKRPFISDLLHIFLQPQTILPKKYKFVTGEKDAKLTLSLLVPLPNDGVKSAGGALTVFYSSQSNPDQFQLQQYSVSDLSVKAFKSISCDDIHSATCVGSFLLLVHKCRQATVVSTRGFKIHQKIDLDSDIVSIGGDGTRGILFGLGNGTVVHFVMGESEENFTIVDQKCRKVFNDAVNFIHYVGDSFFVGSQLSLALCSIDSFEVVRKWDLPSVSSVAVPFQSDTSTGIGVAWAVQTDSMIVYILDIAGGSESISKVDCAQVCIEECLSSATSIQCILAVGDVLWLAMNDGSILIMNARTHVPLSLIHLHCSYSCLSSLKIYPTAHVSLLSTGRDKTSLEHVSLPGHFTVLSTGRGLCDSVFTQRHMKMLGTSPLLRSGLHVVALATMTSDVHHRLIETRHCNFPGEDFQLCYVNHIRTKSNTVSSKTPLEWPTLAAGGKYIRSGIRRFPEHNSPEDVQGGKDGRTPTGFATLGAPLRATEVWYKKMDPHFPQWNGRGTSSVSDRTSTFIGEGMGTFKPRLNLSRGKYLQHQASPPSQLSSNFPIRKQVATISNEEEENVCDQTFTGYSQSTKKIEEFQKQLRVNSRSPQLRSKAPMIKQRSQSSDSILGLDGNRFQECGSGRNSSDCSELDLAVVRQLNSSESIDQGYDRPSDMTTEILSSANDTPEDKLPSWIYVDESDDLLLAAISEKNALRIQKKRTKKSSANEGFGVPKSSDVRMGYVHMNPSGNRLDVSEPLDFDPRDLNPLSSEEVIDTNVEGEDYVCIAQSNAVEEDSYVHMTDGESATLKEMIDAKRKSRENVESKEKSPEVKHHLYYNLPKPPKEQKKLNQHTNLTDDPVPVKRTQSSSVSSGGIRPYVNLPHLGGKPPPPTPPKPISAKKSPYDYFIPAAFSMSNSKPDQQLRLQPDQQQDHQQLRQQEEQAEQSSKCHHMKVEKQLSAPLEWKSSDRAGWGYVSLKNPKQQLESPSTHEQQSESPSTPPSIHKQHQGRGTPPSPAPSNVKGKNHKYVNIDIKNPPPLPPRSTAKPSRHNNESADTDNLGYMKMFATSDPDSSPIRPPPKRRANTVAHIKVAQTPEEDLEDTISPISLPS